MHAFKYHHPTSLADAMAIAATNADGKILAGGQSLVQAMKLRLNSPTDIVDLGGIKELAGIKVEGSSITIGAMTRHADVENNADVKKMIPALARLAGGIGDRCRRGEAVLGIERLDRPDDFPVPQQLAGGHLVAGERPHTLRGIGRIDQRRCGIDMPLPDDRRRMARAGEIDRPSPVGSRPTLRKAPRSPLPRRALAPESGPVARRAGSARRRVGPRASRTDEQKPHRQPGCGNR